MDMNFCQSCAMPMQPEDLGTNQDGSKNADYCKYCYQQGAFTADISMEEMIDVCIPHMVSAETGFTEESARDMMQKTFPTLKRWKK